MPWTLMRRKISANIAIQKSEYLLTEKPLTWSEDSEKALKYETSKLAIAARTKLKLEKVFPLPF